jgi:hypothetical protein
MCLFVNMWMDVGEAIRRYVEKMVSSLDGMKILLLDRETVLPYESIVTFRLAF